MTIVLSKRIIIIRFRHYKYAIECVCITIPDEITNR